MPRTPLIAANWKMHDPPQGWDGDDSPYEPREDMDVIVLPGFLDLHRCIERELAVGAQCGRPEAQGAFTGDVSMRQLAQRGCKYVLCGHSERRAHHGEEDAFIAQQVEAAIAASLHPIVCIGETADERASGREKEAIERQLRSLLPLLSPLSSIAYEPVWAIGTGETADPDQAQEMHAFIRRLLPKGISENIRILYGGSVQPENAAELMAMEDVDGFLVGTASLHPSSFLRILEAV